MGGDYLPDISDVTGSSRDSPQHYNANLWVEIMLFWTLFAGECIVGLYAAGCWVMLLRDLCAQSRSGRVIWAFLNQPIVVAATAGEGAAALSGVVRAITTGQLSAAQCPSSQTDLDAIQSLIQSVVAGVPQRAIQAAVTYNGAVGTINMEAVPTGQRGVGILVGHRDHIRRLRRLLVSGGLLSGLTGRLIRRRRVGGYCSHATSWIHSVCVFLIDRGLSSSCLSCHLRSI